jgi:hypothetical protein
MNIKFWWMKVIKWEWTIFTVHVQEKTILGYTYFQDLMRHYWEMTEKLLRNGLEMTEKFLRNYLEMTEKWLRHDWDMTVKWLRNDWEMTEKWLRNAWEMTEKWQRNAWEMTEKWMRKCHSWPLLTDIIHSHSLFMNSWQWNCLKLSHPANISYCPIPSHSVPFIFSWLAILHMFGAGFIFKTIHFLHSLQMGPTDTIMLHNTRLERLLRVKRVSLFGPFVNNVGNEVLRIQISVAG